MSAAVQEAFELLDAVSGQDEEWCPVVGYEGTYWVSSMGRVFSAPRPRTRGGIRRAPRSGRAGYPTVTLVQDGIQTHAFVHVLVARAFLGEKPDGWQTRHLDGDSSNCALENLAYGTASDNMRDAVLHGTHPTAGRTHCPYGHPLSGDNVRRYPSRPTTRVCLACERPRSAARHRARRLAGAIPTEDVK